jgi:endonuclease YncB( thermonuclease family)
VRPAPTRVLICCLTALLVAARATLGADLGGPVRVIDGDTLDMAGVRIRLWEIDAPERAQTCQGRDGQTYECGRDSAA